MILALDRVQIANYVSTLIWIYTLLLLARILLSWVPNMPYNPAVRAITGFIEDLSEPYLAIWRKLIPPLRAGGGAIDVSPILAILVLNLIGNLVVRAIAG